MEQADIERVRRALLQRPKPPWRMLWRGRSHRLHLRDPSMGPWHGAALGCSRVGSYCWRSGCAVTWPRSIGSAPAGVGATTTPTSWPTISSAVNSGIRIPRWRSARSVAGRSPGPTVGRP
jgi:hypothetical protein